MDEEFNKYRSEVDFTLYLEDTNISDFEYRFDELIKFMRQWKKYYPIDEDFRIGTEKALEVIWHPITRPYSVYARLLPDTLKDNGGNLVRDRKNTFDFMSVNWFQVGGRLKLIFTHERWFFVFPPLFDILEEIGKDWQGTQRDIRKYIQEQAENYHIELTGQPFAMDTVQAVRAGETVRDDWDKMTEETKDKFRSAWNIYSTMCEEYKNDVLDGASQKAKPTIQDFRARVISDMDWKVGDRRLRKVITCGEANLIK